MLILAAAVFAAGCAKPSAQPASPHPDAAQLAGQWQQFIPIESMPVTITLDASGSAALDSTNARWRLDGGNLVIRRSSGEESYSYTVSGYMMTLYNTSTDTSCFYINPAVFAADTRGNAEIEGQWAEWSGWGKMAFDGKTELDSVIYTDAGSSEVKQQYAAHDGILQTVDTSGNYTYNLYSLSQEGALLLAETTDYDNDVKQWTSYWKRAEPDSAYLGQWARVISASPGDSGMPENLQLNDGGSGVASVKGGNPAGFTWEYYAGGFIVMQFSATNILYAWCGVQGGVLYVGNPDVDDCWYIDVGRYKPSAAPLGDLAGSWKTDDGAHSLDITAAGTLTLRGGADAPAAYTAVAADGLLRLGRGGNTWYAAYTVQDNTISLYCAGLPAIGQQDMPVVFSREGSQ